MNAADDTPPRAPALAQVPPPPRAFVATLIGAAFLAWVPAARTPEPARASPAPSYATMATSLTMLYPASRPHALDIVRTVHEEADRHGLDPCLVMAVIARESSFDPRARNRRDVGLMQLNLDWHRDRVAAAGGPQALLDPVRNVRAGTALLAHYRRLGGDDPSALQRYHGLDKRNGYVERVRTEARRLDTVGACLGPSSTTVASR
ncbi:MAG TPA: transglycosylase SLT domain-containing protein [Burkholderiaceae bacterium]|nr:transglycosylase SLT domain-containing protein [Burkholderiaceae bacterium]